MAIWTELSGDEAIDAILAMIDEEIRVTDNMFMFLRGGIPNDMTPRYQEIRDMIDGGNWKDFIGTPAKEGNE
jgi:hypothetical protein